MARKGENAWNMLTKGEAVAYALLIFIAGMATQYGLSLLL